MKKSEANQNVRNRQAQDELLRLFEQEDIYITELEKHVIGEFFSEDLHFSIGKIKTRLEKRGITPSLRDIAATMDKLLDYGFAKKSEFEEMGEPLFEHNHLTEHHDHMVCIKCDRIIEFCVPTMEKLQNDVAERHHFRSLNHKLEIYGICGDCQGRRDPVIPLSLASPGETLFIKKIKVDEKEKKRLHDMGLVTGEKVDVINNAGQLIISVKDTRVALDGRTASKIFVSFEKRPQ